MGYEIENLWNISMFFIMRGGNFERVLL